MTGRIMVVGAGMSGLCTALSLAETGFDVDVVDAHWPQGPRAEGYDLRVSALNLATRQLLQRLGVWTRIEAMRYQAYTRMQVWDGEGTASIAFNAEEAGLESLGSLVENRVTVAAMMAALEASPRIRQIDDTVVDARCTPDGAWVRLAVHGEQTPALLVAADGAQSPVRSLVGIPVREWSYGQQAMVTTVQCEQHHQNTCWQVFTRHGPLAFLPLPGEGPDAGHVCSIVWSQDDAIAQSLMDCDEPVFCERLMHAFEGRLGRLSLRDRRLSVPLLQRHALDYIRPCFALVGDAAHTVHPLAGQGINLGFMDAATLAEELRHGLERGLPLAHLSVLKRYQRRRKSANLAVMALMEAFKRGYGPAHWAFHLARNIGMTGVNRQPWIKHTLLEHACGLRGDVPAIACPAHGLVPLNSAR